MVEKCYPGDTCYADAVGGVSKISSRLDKFGLEAGDLQATEKKDAYYEPFLGCAEL